MGANHPYRFRQLAQGAIGRGVFTCGVFQQKRLVPHGGKGQRNRVFLPRGEPTVAATGTNNDRRSRFMRDEPVMVVLKVTYDRRVV